MEALSPGLVLTWLLAAAVATAIARLVESDDRPVPRASVQPLTVAGAALAVRVIPAVQPSKQTQ